MDSRQLPPSRQRTLEIPYPNHIKNKRLFLCYPLVYILVNRIPVRKKYGLGGAPNVRSGGDNI